MIKKTAAVAILGLIFVHQLKTVILAMVTNILQELLAALILAVNWVCVFMGAVLALTLGYYLLPVIGFTAQGIAKGSLAALMMSLTALLNGGSVATRSLVSLLQSAGAGGFVGLAFLVAVGAVFGGLYDWLG